jgi:PEP-CTERM motif
MKKLLRIVSITAVLSGLAVATQAQVIGGWQDYTDNGWIDWANGQSITSVANAAPAGAYSFVNSIIPGYDTSLRVEKSGWNQTLSIKLQNTPGDLSAFMDNHLLSFTFSTDGTGFSSGWDQINQFVINAPGWGFNMVPWADFTATGDQAANGAMPNFYFWGEGVQSQTVTIDYSSILPQISANPGYIELIFTSNNGGGAPDFLDFNNVVLSGGPVPEPSTLALIGLGAAGMLWLRRKNS